MKDDTISGVRLVAPPSALPPPPYSGAMPGGCGTWSIEPHWSHYDPTAAAFPMQAIGVAVGTAYGGPYSFPPCPGCNDAYKTQCAGMTPHNQAECVAYKRGYEAGLAEGRREK